MVKAVIFDMFETLVSLFEGKAYFGEDMAADIAISYEEFRDPWHATENDRTLGKMTIEEGIGAALRVVGAYSEENVQLLASKRRASLDDTFSAIPKESDQLLQHLHDNGIKTGLISNCFSDEAEYIRKCRLYPLLDKALLSYEEGIGKPNPAIYLKIVEELDVHPEECLYVGDGGSNELFTAEEIGMKPIQALWYRPIMYEPHVPSPVYEEFLHAETQTDIEKQISIMQDLNSPNTPP